MVDRRVAELPFTRPKPVCKQVQQGGSVERSPLLPSLSPARMASGPASRLPNSCRCGGDPFGPEHGLSAQHLGWLGVSGLESEAGFQAAVVKMAEFLGWRVYHTFDSRRSTPGFPDLVLVKGRVLYRECKTDNGRLSPAQVDWLEALTRAGADVKVWRPADWKEIERQLE